MTNKDLENTIAMLNCDMVGVGDTLCVITANASEFLSLVNEANNCIDSFDYKRTNNVAPNSDHASFANVGIPSIFLEYQTDSNYHTDNDTIDKINKQNLINTCNVVCSLCSYISSSPDAIKRE